jgi:hypothetical protein
LATQVCCAAYAGNRIEIDGTRGVDKACCGSGTDAKACATIAYAVSLASETGISGTTLHVANPPNGRDWTADTFPIAIDEGLTLSAPGLNFSDPNSDETIFLVAPPAGTLNPIPSVIEGSSAAPIHVGFDSLGNSTHSTYGITVKENTLYLLNAEIHVPAAPSCSDCEEYAGILVKAGGSTLTLGADGKGNSGTVWIGSPDAGQGEIGIACEDRSATVNDTGSAASPSVWIQNVECGLTSPSKTVRDSYGTLSTCSYTSKNAQCHVSLTASPRFGLALNDAGTCDSHADAIEVMLDFGGTISNATFECAEVGLLDRSPSGSIFVGDNDLFQQNGEGASFGGSEKITKSTFRSNGWGVDVEGDVDLSGGNQISCNNGYPGFPRTGIGVIVVNEPVGWTVNAEHVLWDHWDADAGHTQIWSCADVAESSCTCVGASSCPSGPGALPSSVDVFFNTVPPRTSIDDANGGQATDGCP